MKTKIGLIIIVNCLLFIACNSKKEVTEEHEILPENIVEMNDSQYKMAGIVLGKIEEKELSGSLRINGLISVPPQSLVSVSANMGGYVKSTNLVQGSPVRKGQVIAIVENADFIELEQNFLESKTRLEYAEAEFLRQKELNKENVNSTKTYQLAVSEYKSLKTKVAALEQKLVLIGINAKTFTEEKISGSIPIYSPINGYIKSVNVNIGKYVNPTDVMFEIINNQNLTLELTMYEKDIENVKIGQNISFTSPNKPENNYTAKVYQVGRAINDDKSVKVYANVNGESAGLMSGMYVNAFVESGLNSVTALPNEAIVNFEGKSYIFVSKGKRKEEGKEVNDFLMVEVKRGVSSNGFTEVILPEKFSVELSKVVIKGAYNLLSAMKNAGDMAC